MPTRPIAILTACVCAATIPALPAAAESDTPKGFIKLARGVWTVKPERATKIASATSARIGKPLVIERTRAGKQAKLFQRFADKPNRKWRLVTKAERGDRALTVPGRLVTKDTTQLVLQVGAEKLPIIVDGDGRLTNFGGSLRFLSIRITNWLGTSTADPRPVKFQTFNPAGLNMSRFIPQLGTAEIHNTNAIIPIFDDQPEEVYAVFRFTSNPDEELQEDDPHRLIVFNPQVGTPYFMIGYPDEPTPWPSQSVPENQNRAFTYEGVYYFMHRDEDDTCGEWNICFHLTLSQPPRTVGTTKRPAPPEKPAAS